jgi:hypothetical protein
VTEQHNSIVRGTYAPIEKAESVLRLLVEGVSIRSIGRITGMEQGVTSPVWLIQELLMSV